MNAPLTQYEILSGAQAVEDICGAMLKAAGAALQAHGDDPTAPAIVAAAFCMTVERIDQHIDRTFKKRILMQLGDAS